jgi:hypothetical protein
VTYAKQTAVPVERSKREIEQMLYKHGARNFLTGTFQGRAVVAFELNTWRVQFEVALPAEETFQTVVRRGRKVKATELQAQTAREQAEKERWRALALAIKARLISIETGIETWQEAFLAHVVVPGDGRRFSTRAIPALQQGYAEGDLPPLLPSGAA